MSVRVALSLLLMAAGSVARAAPPVTPSCAPLGEPEFMEMVGLARQFIAEDRPTAHVVTSQAIEDRVPCLTFVPPVAVWAEYLVGLAAVRYLQDGDWQSPLAAAVQAVPSIDRGVNADHEIALWRPAPPLPSPGPVPEGTSLFVDGVLQPDLPPAQGLHLVQVRTWSGTLYSALVKDQPVPSDWFQEARPREGGSTARMVGSVVGGLDRFSQVVEAPGSYAGDSTALGGEVGASLSVGFGRPVGLAIELLGTSAPRFEAALLGTVGARAFTVGLGAAAATAELVVEGEVHRSLLVVPTASVGTRVGPEDGTVFDAALAGGWTPALTRGALRLGVAPPGDTFRWRAGLESRIRSARFVQLDSERRLAATDLSVLAELGLVLGGW